MTEYEVFRVACRSPITLEDAQSRGFIQLLSMKKHCTSFSTRTEHMSPLSAGLVHCVLYIKQMYTVSYFEIYCDDGIPEATREYFTYQEAQAYAKSFEDWEDVRVDRVPLQPEVLPSEQSRLSTFFLRVLYIPSNDSRYVSCLVP